MSGTSIRELIELAQHTSDSGFADRVGSLVLVGPDGDHDPDEWSYGTQSGAGPKENNPLAQLLDSVAFGMRKGDGTSFSRTVLIGRAASNDVRIDDPSISKLHARFDLQSRELSDAKSRNGTFVEEHRLEAGKAAVLSRGSNVRFGDRSFRVYDALRLHSMLARFRGG
jgi:pSer/pThr/pTyr-binding forkhead associated (FHA) protein